MKTSLAHASSLPCLTSVRASTSLKSSLVKLQPIFPESLSTTVYQRHQSKKRVRFALKLEPSEGNSSSSSDQENSAISPTKSSKRVTDPWREDGPLYGAYVEYLEKKDALTTETTETHRASEPEVEPSTYTHTFVIQSKSPDIIIDSITVSTPSRHLPRLFHQTKPTKKMNRKPLTSIADPYSKQRMSVPIPPRRIQSKKISPSSANNKNQDNSNQPVFKRIELSLPPLKTLNSNERIPPTDYCLGTKIVNEYLPTKKLTEIITNPLPGTNNQLNHITGHSILSNLSKTSQISCQDEINNQPYFFQNHDNDHFQPVIH